MIVIEHVHANDVAENEPHWAAERTNFPREVVKAALARSFGHTDRSHLRGDLFEKRRGLTDAWAAHCQMAAAAGAA
jgi:hypothetical protein